MAEKKVAELRQEITALRRALARIERQLDEDHDRGIRSDFHAWVEGVLVSLAARQELAKEENDV